MDNSLITLFGFSFNLYGLIILALAVLLIFALYREQRCNHLDWTDMITRDGKKISATKIMQLIGGVVSTWVIIKTTMNDKLTWDLLAIYLAYVASADGFSKFIAARYNGIGRTGSDT
jgi:hypothetical protein